MDTAVVKAYWSVLFLISHSWLILNKYWLNCGVSIKVSSWVTSFSQVKLKEQSTQQQYLAKGLNISCLISMMIVEPANFGHGAGMSLGFCSLRHGMDWKSIPLCDSLLTDDRWWMLLSAHTTKSFEIDIFILRWWYENWNTTLWICKKRDAHFFFSNCVSFKNCPFYCLNFLWNLHLQYW